MHHVAAPLGCSAWGSCSRFAQIATQVAVAVPLKNPWAAGHEHHKELRVISRAMVSRAVSDAHGRLGGSPLIRIYPNASGISFCC